MYMGDTIHIAQIAFYKQTATDVPCVCMYFSLGQLFCHPPAVFSRASCNCNSCWRHTKAGIISGFLRLRRVRRMTAAFSDCMSRSSLFNSKLLNCFTSCLFYTILGFSLLYDIIFKILVLIRSRIQILYWCLLSILCIIK